MEFCRYDKKHDSNYLETLELYLKYNGSIQAVAEAMFTHRNTVIYRITNIKKLLGTELDTTEERLVYQVAFYIRNMQENIQKIVKKNCVYTDFKA